jgi:predicted choloylglycine hydrolase
VELVYQAIAEEVPGAKWQQHFSRAWPAYESWFLREGARARPYYLTSVRALRQHMPELEPTYERLVELAGGGDIEARFLSLYCPPPYLTGCSQAVWSGRPPLLVRNYDYSPRLCEGVTLKTAWNGKRVIAMSDCLWGVLDGINENGLALSLSFGGRQVVGEGFGMPLVLRYMLEFCDRADEAVKVLERVPSHMAYNVTVLDRTGRFVTVYIAPDRPVRVLEQAYCTNHQDQTDSERYIRTIASREREQFIAQRLRRRDTGAESLVQAFLRPPLYSTAYARGFGTLYTAVYRPHSGQVEYLWPDFAWRQSFESFAEGARRVVYPDADGAPAGAT